MANNKNFLWTLPCRISLNYWLWKTGGFFIQFIIKKKKKKRVAYLFFHMDRTFSQNEDSLHRDQHDKPFHMCDCHMVNVSHTPEKFNETKWMQCNRTTYQAKTSQG